ncbi:recQ-mediated genome instability protein 2-like isoform X2 [Tachypleus tridentatus]|uniref:recQ-mediated genome instability protein 2-like isoform X2 n=1 Tax=Tachypleus tridentatus TaxID=6853 RepID=UPI003FD4E18D
MSEKTILDIPARKVFIRHLTKLTATGDEERFDDGKKLFKWNMKMKNKTFTLGLVWIQGLIVQVNNQQDSLLLDDGSGVATVVAVQKAPGAGDWIKLGQYCMVLGDLQDNSVIPSVRAVKLMNLQNNMDVETLWITEVLDLWNYLDLQQDIRYLLTLSKEGVSVRKKN